MTVGDNIRAVRQRIGLTQKQLGEKCGIAEPTIRRYELNLLNPKFDTIVKIAGALGVSASHIMTCSEIDGGFWTQCFRTGLSKYLLIMCKSDADTAKFDMESAIEIAEGGLGFSFEDACVISDSLGVSLDEILEMGKTTQLVDGKK